MIANGLIITYYSYKALWIECKSYWVTVIAWNSEWVTLPRYWWVIEMFLIKRNAKLLLLLLMMWMYTCPFVSRWSGRKGHVALNLPVEIHNFSLQFFGGVSDDESKPLRWYVNCIKENCVLVPWNMQIYKHFTWYKYIFKFSLSKRSFKILNAQNCEDQSWLPIYCLARTTNNSLITRAPELNFETFKYFIFLRSNLANLRSWGELSIVIQTNGLIRFRYKIPLGFIIPYVKLVQVFRYIMHIILNRRRKAVFHLLS